MDTVIIIGQDFAVHFHKLRVVAMVTTFEQIGLMLFHTQGTIFTPECYGHAVMVTISALHLQVVPTDCGKIKEENTISLQPIAVLSDIL